MVDELLAHGGAPARPQIVRRPKMGRRRVAVALFALAGLCWCGVPQTQQQHGLLHRLFSTASQPQLLWPEVRGLAAGLLAPAAAFQVPALLSAPFAATPMALPSVLPVEHAAEDATSTVANAVAARLVHRLPLELPPRAALATSGQMTRAARTNPVLLYGGGGQLVLERAPPAPPPAPPGGRGGGGGGDGESYFLRLLKLGEQIDVLNEWIGRSRVYAMSDDAEIVNLHVAAMAEMEALKEFSESAGRAERWADRKMVLAYVDQDDQVHALAGAMVSAIKGLIVQSVVVHPAELNNKDSTAWFGLKHGLELLAITIDVKLDNTPISEDPQPICMRVTRDRETGEGPVSLPRREPSPAPEPDREWTRWASRARDLDAAVLAEDYTAAKKIQAEFDALAAEDDALLNRLATELDAAIAEEDYQAAAKIKAQLDAVLQEGA